MEDNLLAQLVSESTRGGAQLDLLFVSKEAWVGDMVVGGCFGHSYHKTSEFKGTGSAELTPCISSGLFRSLVDSILRESPERQRGPEKPHILQEGNP